MTAPQKFPVHSRRDFLAVVSQARAMVREQFAQVPEWEVVHYLLEQLDLVASLVADGRTPTAQETEQVTLGIFAVKNFEYDEDEELRTILCRIHGRLREYATLPP